MVCNTLHTKAKIYLQIIVEGEKLILEIKVEGEPTKIRWLKDGIAVPESANAKIEKIDERT